jgi:hypothetical protein
MSDKVIDRECVRCGYQFAGSWTTPCSKCETKAEPDKPVCNCNQSPTAPRWQHYGDCPMYIDGWSR